VYEYFCTGIRKPVMDELITSKI